MVWYAMQGRIKTVAYTPFELRLHRLRGTRRLCTSITIYQLPCYLTRGQGLMIRISVYQLPCHLNSRGQGLMILISMYQLPCHLSARGQGLMIRITIHNFSKHYDM